MGDISTLRPRNSWRLCITGQEAVSVMLLLRRAVLAQKQREAVLVIFRLKKEGILDKSKIMIEAW